MSLMFPKQGPKKKKKRPQDRKHIDFVRGLPCIGCGTKGPTVSPHHLLRGKNVKRGMGLKAEDKHTLPICNVCHHALHCDGDEVRFLKTCGVHDGEKVAENLYEFSLLQDRTSALLYITKGFALRPRVAHTKGTPRIL